MITKDIIRKTVKKNKPFVLAVVISSCGSTPQVPGAKMTIFIDGTIIGTVGGGCVEKTVISESIKLLSSDISNKIININLTDQYGTRNGDVCGGTMKIYIEKYF